MSKTPISRVICGVREYEPGKVYTNEEVADLDPKDFKDVPDEKKEEEIPKVVDQQMLDENPVLAENGVEVGSEISEATDEEVEKAKKKAAGKKKGKK